MEGSINVFDYLAQLRKQNGKKVQSHQDLLAYLEAKARIKGIPLVGQFELTPLCNLNCKMCYVHLLPEQLKGQSVLSVSVWKNLMYQACKAGMIHASLSGGECMVYPGFEELYLYLQSLGCEVGVLTNGVLMDEKRIQFFKEHRPENIQVTLYGCNDDVYERVTGQRAFGTVYRNVRSAVDAGLRVTITVTPSVYLGEDVLETIRIAKSLSGNLIINSGIMSPREETGRSKEQHDTDRDLYVRIYRLLNELEGRESREINPDILPAPGGPSDTCEKCGLKCGAGRSIFVMDWKGNLRACNRLDVVEGHALEEGFNAAWTHINKWANDWQRIPKCEGCIYEDVCDNCAGRIIPFLESGNKLSDLCERTRYFVQNGVRAISECE